MRRSGRHTSTDYDGIAQQLISAEPIIRPYIIVFVASTCGLILEIVGARALALVIGIPLFTWTSIIGVVLTGISIGNYTGGQIADRFPVPQTLGFVLLTEG